MQEQLFCLAMDTVHADSHPILLTDMENPASDEWSLSETAGSYTEDDLISLIESITADVPSAGLIQLPMDDPEVVSLSRFISDRFSEMESSGCFQLLDEVYACQVEDQYCFYSGDFYRAISC